MGERNKPINLFLQIVSQILLFLFIVLPTFPVYILNHIIPNLKEYKTRRIIMISIYGISMIIIGDQIQLPESLGLVPYIIAGSLLYIFQLSFNEQTK